MNLPGSGNTALTKVHDVAVFKSWIVPRPEPTSRSDQSTTSELKYAGGTSPAPVITKTNEDFPEREWPHDLRGTSTQGTLYLSLR